MRFVWIVALLAAALAAPPAAEAADYRSGRTVHKDRDDLAFNRGFSGRLPGCADPQVEQRVAYGFAHTEQTYWGSGLLLSAFIRPVEIGYRTWGHSFIPRRFCQAKVYTNDGRRRTVVYNIQEDQAFASVGYGVEWCVTGLDRSYAYAPGCKMARP